MPPMTTPDARRIRFEPGDRVGLVAGSGALPVEVAAWLAASGHPPFVLIIDGEPGRREELAAYPHAVMPLEEFAGFVPLMRKERVTHIVLAGGVTRRPRLSALRWSAGILPLLPRLALALARGDDGLLRVLVAYAERSGFKVVGAHEIVPDLLASEGALTRRKPTAAARRDLDAATEAARAIGRLDIGQAAVAVGGRAIALEGVEGTDGLLARVRDLRDHPRLAGKKGGVLVKCAKPGQELRADLPAIGPATVDAAHRAGLAGIGVEAGRSFLLDHAATLARADELGLFIVGLPRGEA